MNPELTACNYALLRYLPYPETGEFVNVGVAVCCLQPGFLEFCMDGPRVFPRVKAFFPELNEENFEAAHAAIAVEFERVTKQIKQARDPKTAQRAFHELVRARESIFRFGEVRTILSPDPDNLATELFDRYVRRVSSQRKKPQVTAAD